MRDALGLEEVVGIKARVGDRGHRNLVVDEVGLRVEHRATALHVGDRPDLGMPVGRHEERARKAVRIGKAAREDSAERIGAVGAKLHVVARAHEPEVDPLGPCGRIELGKMIFDELEGDVGHRPFKMLHQRPANVGFAGLVVVVAIGLHGLEEAEAHDAGLVRLRLELLGREDDARERLARVQQEGCGEEKKLSSEMKRAHAVSRTVGENHTILEASRIPPPFPHGAARVQCTESGPQPIQSGSADLDPQQDMTDRLPKTPRGRNRAVELLRCAIDVFIEYGYEGASLSRIIERSGGSRTVIYQVYGNKEGLFLAALGMMADDVYQAYVSDYHPGRSLREEFEAFGRIFLTGMFTERAVGACRLVFAQSFARRDIGEFFYREGVKKSYQCFARVLQNHVDAPIEELEEAAARFIEMLRGPLLMRILCTPETQVTPEEIEEAAVRSADIMTVWMNERWPETRAA